MARSDDPHGSRGLLRFVLAERLSHWLYAGLFLGALVTGLLMWIPATRAWMGETRQEVAQWHWIAGYLMVTLPVLLFASLDRRRLRRDLHDVDVWSADDRAWFWRAVRGGALLRREMPPQGRFNAGQKLNVILVAAMALGFTATGSVLVIKADMPTWLVSRAHFLHDALAVGASAVFAGHVAHVVLTRHGCDYLKAMIRGRLSDSTARERHRAWWEESRPTPAGPPE